jgi:DNA invertase Pin-like site-specific DNA recombinase
MQKFVSYYRVSTGQQGRSGLGLEAQQAEVEAYVAREGGALVAPPFIEVESGKCKTRPELSKAIAHARRHKAVLLVAKLDRLARNVAFLSSLMESKIDFRAVDNPHATRLTIHIMAAVAEEEARATSVRTKAALAAAKARGVLLGSARPDHWVGSRLQARMEGQKKATKAAAKSRIACRIFAVDDVLPKIKQLRTEGLSLRAISKKLNEEGSFNLQVMPWSPMAVHRILLSDG